MFEPPQTGQRGGSHYLLVAYDAGIATYRRVSFAVFDAPLPGD